MDAIPWSKLIQWTTWAVAMGFAMRWLVRSQNKPLGKDQAGTLRQPTATLVTGVAGLLFFAALAVLSNVYANETTSLWTTAIFVGFAALSLLVLVEYYRAWHRLTKDGLEYGRLWRARGTLRWSQLKRVRYAAGMQWFCLETESGDTVRVSGMLRGLPEFAQTLLRFAPQGTIEPETWRVLQFVAKGNSPLAGLP